MKSELPQLLDHYYKWLRSETHLIEDEQSDWTAISTPYSGIYNDGIEIYCKKENGKWILSDGGDSLNLLEQIGLKISLSSKRKEILNQIINNYGISWKKDELFVEANEKNFAQKKHYLLQALLEVHELEQLAERRVKSLFKEDVEALLNKYKILYTKDVKFIGFNGLNYHFDFQVRKYYKEHVIKAADSLRKNTLNSFIYSWQNVRKVRENNTNKSFDAAVVLNDSENEPKANLIEAFEKEGVEIYYWSNKTIFYEALSTNGSLFKT
jgi:hypothetical protein